MRNFLLSATCLRAVLAASNATSLPREHPSSGATSTSYISTSLDQTRNGTSAYYYSSAGPSVTFNRTTAAPPPSMTIFSSNGNFTTPNCTMVDPERRGVCYHFWTKFPIIEHTELGLSLGASTMATMDGDSSATTTAHERTSIGIFMPLEKVTATALLPTQTIAPMEPVSSVGPASGGAGVDNEGGNTIVQILTAVVLPDEAPTSTPVEAQAEGTSTLGDAILPQTSAGQDLGANSIGGIIASVLAGGGYGADQTATGSYAVVTNAYEPPGYPAAAPVVTVAGHEVTADTSGNYAIGSQTLVPGGSAVVTAGTTYSLSPSGTSLAVNGAEEPVRIGMAGPALTFAGHAVTADTAGDYVIGSQTLVPGAPAIVADGTTYSLSPSGSRLAVDGVEQPVDVGTAAPALTLASHTITADKSGDYVIGTETLVPGASAIVVGGTTYSLSPSGTSLAVNGVKQPVKTGEESVTAASADAYFSADGQIFPLGPSGVVISGSTLAAGHQITVAGTTYSLESSETALVVNGVTEMLQYATMEPVLTLGSNVYTEISATPGFVIGSQTLRSGGTVTVGLSSVVETLRMMVGQNGATDIVFGTTSTLIVEVSSRPTLGVLSEATGASMSLAAEASGATAASPPSVMTNVTAEVLKLELTAGLLVVVSMFVTWL